MVMRKITLSLLLIGGVALAALGATGAFFSDTETSAGNTFEAGALDLKVDNSSYYNGATSSATTWAMDDLPGHLFFNFLDVKPDDYGEDTISLHAENDAYACMSITKTLDDDIDCTEPELLDDTLGSKACNEPDNDQNDGELGSQLLFMFWADDGDNVLENNENPAWRKGPASSLFNGSVWPLADSTTNIWGSTPSGMIGGQTYYIAKAWCFGSQLQPIPLAQDGIGAGNPRNPATSTGGINCDGTLLNNSAQTDKFMADVQFTAIQKRHNTNFKCVPNGTPVPSPTGKPTPTPVACIDDADVMMVLDRSGSISATELADLKNAATSFVTALNPSAPGSHVGMSSFSTNATLNVHLTSTAATVNTAINALSSGGFTNLYEGLLLAGNELLNPGDGDDRADLTSPDHVVVITDGNPNRPQPDANARAQALAQATALKGGGATVYVVGVGNDVDAVYLQTIASPGQYYSIANYTDLSTALAGIATQCPTPAPN